MVKFFKDGSVLALVEKPNWVYLMDNGCYGLCELECAQGVAIRGAVYNINENEISDNGKVSFAIVENGEYMMQQDKVAEQNAANVDYLAMMTGYDLPTEETTDEATEETVEETTETEVATNE